MEGVAGAGVLGGGGELEEVAVEGAGATRAMTGDEGNTVGVGYSGRKSRIGLTERVEK